MPKVNRSAAKRHRVPGAEFFREPERLDPIILAMLQAGGQQMRFNPPQNIAALKTNREFGSPQAVCDKADGVAQFEPLPRSKDERSAAVATVKFSRRDS